MVLGFSKKLPRGQAVEAMGLLGLTCGPVNATPPATGGVELPSPIRPADELLPIVSRHPDFPNTRFFVFNIFY